MNRLIIGNISGGRNNVPVRKSKKSRSANLNSRQVENGEPDKRDGDDFELNQIFPPAPPPPAPVLTKNLIRDYILFDRVDDLGNRYRYGVFAVFSSFVKIDSDGNYLDPNIASNVDNETRVITVKTLVDPESFGSNSIGEPIFVEPDPVIEFFTTDEEPTSFIDQIYLYQFGGERFFELKKNTRKKVERDDLEDVIDPMGTPYAIESAISANQQFYNRHILDLYYKIVNMNYVSSTRYDILMQTIIVMLGI